MHRSNVAEAMCAISGMAYDDAKSSQYETKVLKKIEGFKYPGSITRYNSEFNIPGIGGLHQTILVEYDDFLVLGIAGTMSDFTISEESWPEDIVEAAKSALDWGIDGLAYPVPYCSLNSIPGSEKLKEHMPEWLYNFLSLPNIFPAEWRVHGGFMFAVMSTLLTSRGENISSWLIWDLYEKVKGKKNGLYITGHSQGGAMATVSVPLIKILGSVRRGVDTFPVHLYTYASPRPGNMEFATSICALTEEAIGFANWFDPIPQLPLALNNSSKYGMVLSVLRNWGVTDSDKERVLKSAFVSNENTGPELIADEMVSLTLRLQRNETPGSVNSNYPELAPVLKKYAEESNGSFEEILTCYLKKIYEIGADLLFSSIEVICTAASWYYWVTVDTEEKKGLFVAGLYALHYDVLKSILPMDYFIPKLNTDQVSEILSAENKGVKNEVIRSLFRNNLDLEITAKEVGTLFSSEKNMDISELIGIVKWIWNMIKDYAHAGSRVYITNIVGLDPLSTGYWCFGQHSMAVYMNSILGEERIK